MTGRGTISAQRPGQAARAAARMAAVRVSSASRPQLPPLFGIELARQVERDGVALAGDRPDLADRLQRLFVLLVEIEPRRRPVRHALRPRQGLAAIRVVLGREGGRGEHALQLHGPAEGRMGGEDVTVIDPGDPRGEGRERLQLAVLAPGERVQEPADAGAIAPGVKLADIAAQRRRPAGEGIARQALDQGFGRLLVEPRRSHPLLQLQGGERDRVGVGVAVLTAARTGQGAVQGLHRGIGRIGGPVRYGLGGRFAGTAPGRPGSDFALRARPHARSPLPVPRS